MAKKSHKSRSSRGTQSATGSVVQDEPKESKESKPSTRRRRDVPASPDESPQPAANLVSYDSAARENTNVLNKMTSVAATEKQFNDLFDQIDTIEDLVRHQLGVGENQASCVVLDQNRWNQDAFNISIPVKVTYGDNEVSTTLIFRCPKPHCLGPDNLDEKIRGDVGTHVWMQQKCPDVRIPHLYGFGLSDGRHFTHVRHRSFIVRIGHAIRRLFYSIFSRQVLSRYTRNSSDLSIPSGYILTEHVGSEIGQPLSSVWANLKDDRERRKNLLQGLSRIILSLARIPQPRIGSFQFNDDGTVALSNRYLTASVATLESQGVKSTIDDEKKHTTTDYFVDGLLELHENRFLADMTVVQDKDDCRRQMAGITLLRAISHRYLKREYRHGPYLLQLGDLDQSDIIVDDDWNVACLTNLEWICALPVEMLNLPYCIAGCGVDEMVGDRYSYYAKRRREFIGKMREDKEVKEENEEDGEKQEAALEHEIPIPDIMDEAWKSKGMWFWHCMTFMGSMIPILDDHLSPKGRPSTRTEKDLAEFWCEDADEVVRKKLLQRVEYDELLKGRFV